MTRATVLFLIVGLAVGLWLGFNPQAHQQTIKQWDSVKSGFLNLKAGSSVQIRGLSTQTTTSSSSSKSSSKSRHRSLLFLAVAAHGFHSLETGYHCV